MTNNICVHLQELMDAERPALEEEIDKNKYYLSKKANCDVGWEAAEKDFREHYLDTWASGFRAAYCNHVCPDGKNCELKNK